LSLIGEWNIFTENCAVIAVCLLGWITKGSVFRGVALVESGSFGGTVGDLMALSSD